MDSSTAAPAVLPVELVAWEILVRLPAKALLRCRAVCRSWRRLTSAADFLLAHHRHQPSLPLVVFIKTTNGSISTAWDLDALELRQRPTGRQPVLRLSSTVHASCDGLILLSGSTNRHVYLCNPLTRQWISLPSLNGASVAGMYSDAPSGEYRVLYWTAANKPDVADVVCYVLTVGSSAKPRRIEQPFASPSVQQFLHGGGLSSIGIVRLWPAVLLHNCLHWFSRWHSQEAIVVFHTVTASFRLVHLPTGAPRLLLLSPLLYEMDGTLGISWVSQDMLKLYVLRDYETEAWSLKYQIEYPVAEMNVSKDVLFGGMTVSEDGDALIHCDNLFLPKQNCDSPDLFHVDRNGKLLQTFGWDNIFSRVTGLLFKESLFRHAFFEVPRGEELPRQPFFFHWI